MPARSEAAAGRRKRESPRRDFSRAASNDGEPAWSRRCRTSAAPGSRRRDTRARRRDTEATTESGGEAVCARQDEVPPASPRSHGAARRGDRRPCIFASTGLRHSRQVGVTNRQARGGRIAATRKIRRSGSMDQPVHGQSRHGRIAETRMGSGRGSPEGWVAGVTGRVMLSSPASTSRSPGGAAARGA